MRGLHRPPAILVHAPVCGLIAQSNATLTTSSTDWKKALRDCAGWPPKTRQNRANDIVVTNPPYKYAGKFVAHALTLAPTVIMLLRLAFMESTRRTTILENSGLARVHVFRERLPMMHRDGWTGKRATSAIPFAWFVWDRDHIGPATLNRISWKTDGFFCNSKFLAFRNLRHRLFELDHRGNNRTAFSDR
jgi:hypothetical protein